MPILLINNEVLPIEIGETILDAARRNAVHIGFVCDGNGLCQMCQCRVLHGAEYLSYPNDAERVWLTEEQLREGHRLSCQTTVCGDGMIEVVTRAETLRSQVDAMFTPSQETTFLENIGQLMGYIISANRQHIRKFPQNAVYATRQMLSVRANVGTGLRMLQDSRSVINRMVSSNTFESPLLEQQQTTKVPSFPSQKILPELEGQRMESIGVAPAPPAIPAVTNEPTVAAKKRSIGDILFGNLSNRMQLLVTGLVLITLALSLVTPYATWVKHGRLLSLLPVNLRGFFPTLTSDVSNPNVMAGQIVILLPFAVALLLAGWRSFGVLRWLLAVLTTPVAFGILLFNQSTGSFIGLIAMVIVAVLLRLVRKKWGIIDIGLFALIGITVPVGIYLAISNASFLMEQTILVGSSQNTKSRVELWTHALFLIRDFPFTGIGMGTYQQVAHALYPFEVIRPSAAFHAHNILLQVGVDLGIPGLIAWLTLFFVVLKQGWTMLQDGRRTNKRWLSNIGIAIICSQTALITHGMVDAVTWGMIRPAPIVWVVWGLALAYTKAMSQEQTEDSQQTSQKNPPSPQA